MWSKNTENIVSTKFSETMLCKHKYITHSNGVITLNYTIKCTKKVKYHDTKRKSNATIKNDFAIFTQHEYLQYI